MTNCFEVLKEEQDLRGYSTETIGELMQESLPIDECEKLAITLEMIYG
jgi:hypothetical protein